MKIESLDAGRNGHDRRRQDDESDEGQNAFSRRIVIRSTCSMAAKAPNVGINGS